VTAADQASRLRSLVASVDADEPGGETDRAQAGASVRPAPIVAVCSGKGGVGKTTLAVNTAIILAQTGLRVTLVDLDVGVGNTDLLMGVTPERRLTREALHAGDFASRATDTRHRVRLIAGVVGDGDTARLDAADMDGVVRGLESLRADADLVLVDTGAGIGFESVALASSADRTLVVTTPEPAAMTDAYAMIKCIARTQSVVGGSDAPLFLVVNSVKGKDEARSVAARIARTSAHFLGITVASVGHVRADKRVAAAAREQTPVVRGGVMRGAAKDITRCARALWDACVSGENTETSTRAQASVAACR
jgi:flagellar biosynthesis protein FlhG